MSLKVQCAPPLQVMVQLPSAQSEAQSAPHWQIVFGALLAWQVVAPPPLVPLVPLAPLVPRAPLVPLVPLEPLLAPLEPLLLPPLLDDAPPSAPVMVFDEQAATSAVHEAKTATMIEQRIGEPPQTGPSASRSREDVGR